MTQGYWKSQDENSGFYRGRFVLCKTLDIIGFYRPTLLYPTEYTPFFKSRESKNMYSTYTYDFAYSILIFHTLNLAFRGVCPLEVNGL